MTYHRSGRMRAARKHQRTMKESLSMTNKYQFSSSEPVVKPAAPVKPNPPRGLSSIAATQPTMAKGWEAMKAREADEVLGSKDRIKTVDAWRRRQEDLPSRAEAIRRLVELGLKVKQPSK